MKLEFIYDQNDLPKGVVGGKSFKNQSLEEVLNELCEDAGLHYKIFMEVVVFEKKESLLLIKKDI